MFGSLVADALAMPVHWYYDTQRLDRDYGQLTGYVAPKNPHSDSILWRSNYTPRNARANILHDQAKYWGQRGVHYHQFLAAGENTINYQLGKELYLKILEDGVYDSEKWLSRYIECLLEGGWHKDTYLEEYHRAFFDNYAKGMAPTDWVPSIINKGNILCYIIVFEISSYLKIYSFNIFFFTNN